jgi:hypothetical protein
MLERYVQTKFDEQDLMKASTLNFNDIYPVVLKLANRHDQITMRLFGIHLVKTAHESLNLFS